MGLLLLSAAAARALDSLSIELDGIDAGNWATGPLSVRIEAHGAQGFGFDMDVRRLRLPPPLRSIRRIRVRCPEGQWERGRLRCKRAELSPVTREGPAVPLVLALEYVQQPARLRLRGRQLAVAGGRLDLDLDLSGAGARVQVSGRDLKLPNLLALIGQWRLRWPALEPYAVSAGRADLDLDFSSPQAGAGNLVVRAGIRNLDFSDSEGLHAGQALGLGLRLRVREGDGSWQFKADGSTATGLLYLDPLLLDFDAGAPELHAEGRWQPGRLLEISRFEFSHPRVLRLQGGGRWSLAPVPRLEQLRAMLPKTPLAPLYEHYLKAYTGAGALSDLTMDGALELDIDWRAGGAGRMDARLTDLSLGDALGRFAIIGLQGDLHWRSGETGPDSRLLWDGAQIYRLDLGAGSMALGLRDDTVELLSAMRLRLLSGSLEVPRLRARSVGRDSLDLEMAARLDDIDLGELGNTLAWVPLSGHLSARIPSLRYRDSRLSASGAIDLSLFDGRARITNLSLEDPFGPVPRLGADLDLRDLSLEQLSQSFSFGAIEGRLQGSIQNLVLDGWQPVSFDARLQTPPGDASRHRISQRAVDNLASLGGANAVLSSTFLRFFNDFSYRRLGLSCRLRAGVCEMGGVAPADPGYYIVEGGGIPPRVDVVGYNHRVDWRTLLERLRAINQLDEVVVQ